LLCAVQVGKNFELLFVEVIQRPLDLMKFRNVLTIGALMAATATLAGCATLPPPTAELEAAKVAVQRAQDLNASQFAPQSLSAAQSYLQQANAALDKGNESDARPLLERAAAVGDLATVQAQAAVKVNDAKARQAQVHELRAKIEQGGAQ
jgi:predicted outer membrane protein